MTREDAIKVLNMVEAHGLADEAKHMAIEALKFQGKAEVVISQLREDRDRLLTLVDAKRCEDAVSRQAVEDKLLKLCNELEEIFADIRMKEVDDCVCGLCEYDCDHGIDGSAFECPGFETDECFKLADEIRHEWQNTKDLPSVTPQQKTGHWIESRCDMYECSECDHTYTDLSGERYGMNYCPNCGCRMVDPQERSDKE